MESPSTVQIWLYLSLFEVSVKPARGTYESQWSLTHVCIKCSNTMSNSMATGDVAAMPFSATLGGTYAFIHPKLVT